MTGLLRKPLVRVLLLALAAVVAVALYLLQPWLVFVDETVDEGGPRVTVAPLVPGANGEPSKTLAVPQPNVVATGKFVSHEHETTGTVKVLQLSDGKRVLRVENLDTSNGPDLRLWLSDQPVRKGPSAWFAFDDGAYVELGKLKGNKGNQNYDIPDGTDLGKLTSVSIWCKRFHVSFGAASLK